MKISRVWAMPNSSTFTIPPIKKLLDKYVHTGIWADPFAGNNSPAQLTNDINPKTKADEHLEATVFCNKLKDNSLDGVLFDPPYSGRQIKECYATVGLTPTMLQTSGAFHGEPKRILVRKVKPGGIAICFGWNSVGFGKTKGFELIEILLVCHGGNHNDTIVTVEQKKQQVLV